jgi:hypothetical protein
LFGESGFWSEFSKDEKKLSKVGFRSEYSKEEKLEKKSEKKLNRR